MCVRARGRAACLCILCAVLHMKGFWRQHGPLLIWFVSKLAKDMIKFPELFKEKQTEEEKSAKDFKKASVENEKIRRKQWSQLDMPVWFR